MPNDNSSTSSLNFRNIRVFIFDLDNTLIPTREADRKTSLECAAWLHKHGFVDEESKFIANNFNTKFRQDPCPEFISTIEELDTWRKDIWKSVLPKQFDGVDELYLFWKEERQKQLMLTKRVENMLEKIRKKYKIAILTNGPSVAQWEKLSMEGIRRYCSTFVVSGDFYVEKPHKDIYYYLCKKLKVKPSECVMIGDSLDTDILGAQNAGFGATILINHDNMEFDESALVMPDKVLEDITDLEAVLPRL